MNTLYNRLAAYGDSDYYAFHMPGHKRQYNMLGNALPYKLDITEIEGFDDLHHAKDILKEAQEYASGIYRADKTYYLINGSTSGILAAVMGCVEKGGRILAARNCHKSVYAAIYMKELRASYIYPEYDAETGLNGPVNADEVRAALQKDAEIQAVVITSPTYDGVVSDVKAIAEAAHAYGVPLIVDGAHGAHFGFHPYFPQNANALGADVVIHSLHKTLPSLTQTALIHVNGSFADYRRIEKYLHMIQTSSPSYVLMASIDNCVRLLGQGSGFFEEYAARLAKLRRKLGELKRLRLVETGTYDPSKIILSTARTGRSGKWLYGRLLEKYHLQMEMAAQTYVLAMTSVGDVQEGYDRLEKALFEIDGELEACERRGKALFETDGEPEACERQRKALFAIDEEPEACERQGSGQALPVLEQVYTSAEADNRETEPEAFFWENCEDKVSAEYAYVYPPGIPLVVPGERISRQAVQRLREYAALGFDIEGTAEQGKIRVLKEC